MPILLYLTKGVYVFKRYPSNLTVKLTGYGVCKSNLNLVCYLIKRFNSLCYLQFVQSCVCNLVIKPIQKWLSFEEKSIFMLMNISILNVSCHAEFWFMSVIVIRAIMLCERLPDYIYVLRMHPIPIIRTSKYK